MNQLWEDTNHVFCDKACISQPVTTLKQNDISKAASNAFSFLTGASMAIGLFQEMVKEIRLLVLVVNKNK